MISFEIILVKHARKSQSLREIEALIALARHDVAITPDELDSDPWLFNCQNGTLDLRTSELKSHNHADYISKISPVVYDAEAPSPTWLAFLNRIFDGKEELISFLQQTLGYALTGRVTEKALFVCVGDGDNGKTTLLEAIRYTMGDYAGIIEINHLMKTASSSEQQHALADLHGKRFVTASEAAEGQRLNEAKIKQITGMGRLTARRMWGHPFEFEPHFKLFIDANYKPLIGASDPAMWSRIRLLPFGISIPKEQQDRQLLNKLKAEAPGILAWAVRGCLEWQSHGHLKNPKTVSEAVEGYRQEMDRVQDFIDDACIIEQNAMVSFSDLYSRYRTWCEHLREEPITHVAFAKWLNSHGFKQDRTAGARMRCGLRLKDIEASNIA